MTATAAQVFSIARSIPTTTDLTGYLATAAVHRARIEAANNYEAMDATALNMVEAYLAAHFWAIDNPPEKSESDGAASATYDTGPLGKGFEATQYGQTAIGLDATGYLRTNRPARATASVHWLGTDPDE